MWPPPPDSATIPPGSSPSTFALTYAHEEYYEADWDDGSTIGHVVDLPTTVTAASTPSPKSSISTDASAEVLALIDDFHNEIIGDDPVVFVAMLRHAEALEGKLPQVVIDRGWLDGSITTDTQEASVFASASATWASALASVRSSHYAALTGISYSVLDAGDALPIVVLEANVSDLEDIIATDAFLAIDTEEVGDVDIDGYTLRGSGQLALDRTLYFNGTSSAIAYDGSGLNGELAFFEWGWPFYVEGFDDGSSTSRVMRWTECTGGTCTASTSPPAVGSTSGHPMTTLAMLAGDWTQGQDPSLTDPLDQERRSAPARGVSCIGVYRSDTAGFSPSVNQMLISSHPRSQIMSFSGDLGRSHPCEYSVASRAVDLAAACGMATFVSSSNAGDDDPDTCDGLGRVGTATGSITTARHNQFRDKVNNASSGDRGGRRIVDLATYGVHNDLPKLVGSTVTWGTGTGTSVAAPMLASAAATYQDFYLDHRSKLGDDPGILYVNLSLMGDFWSVDTCTSTATCTGPDIGYDSTYGAGRFTLRTFAKAATPSDNPGSWMTGRLCVRHGETRRVPIHMPSATFGAYRFTAVSRFIEDMLGTEDDEEMDQVRLRLVKVVEGTPTTIVQDAGADNEKQRVAATVSAGTGTYHLDFTGLSVFGHDLYCGDNAQRVYFAVKVEEG